MGCCRPRIWVLGLDAGKVGGDWMIPMNRCVEWLWLDRKRALKMLPMRLGMGYRQRLDGGREGIGVAQGVACSIVLRWLLIGGIVGKLI